ncbi:hypothetical protein IFM89_009164 [Coptis chinensis]|uniref:Protein SCAI n=1 Tax=Coptis chinensis TaxID=261450 RepID=A0A835IUD1_9MAGN|nr:hypothetical protein IFM89_009164 [Coptis chinensis]
MSQTNNNNTNNNNNIPISEVYWSLVDKADRKFSRVRDLPHYGRARYDTHFQKVFKVYTQLWKFQQENRQKLVESGLKRWEIGEIASRIAQLYYNQYLRTSEASYLSESFIFYDAIFSREYFKDRLSKEGQDINLANKQLRCIARFFIVCLLLNKRDMVFKLVDHFKLLVDECKRNFQETDFKDWKLVVQEIVRFLKVDTAFMNIRPLRFSLVLDSSTDNIQLSPSFDGKRGLKLRDAVLCSYHHNEYQLQMNNFGAYACVVKESGGSFVPSYKCLGVASVKFTELTLDTFRMLQSLEWEPSGSFYQITKISSGNGSNAGQNGTYGANRVNYSQEITDPTLPTNPRKAILYRPAVTHFIAVLATISEELPPDGVLLVYLSASGKGGHLGPLSSSSGAYTKTTESIVGNNPSHEITSEANSSSPSSSSRHENTTYSYGQTRGNLRNNSGCLWMGSCGNGGTNCIYPSDLIPFTRRPLFLIVDSDCSEAFKAGLSTLIFHCLDPLCLIHDMCRYKSMSEHLSASYLNSRSTHAYMQFFFNLTRSPSFANVSNAMMFDEQ